MFRDFVNLAAQELGMKLFWEGEGQEEIAKNEEGKIVISVDPNYYRPNEVETLLGDPSKAQKKLGWRPKVSFEHLVREMVKHDFEQVRAEKMTPTSKLTQDDNERK